MAAIIPTAQPTSAGFAFAPTGMYRPNPYAMPTGIETGKTIESILARERSPVPSPLEQVIMTPVTPIERTQPWAPITPMTVMPTPYGPMMTPISPMMAPIMTPTPMTPWAASVMPIERVQPWSPITRITPTPYGPMMTPVSPIMTPIMTPTPMNPWAAPMTAPWAAPMPWIQPAPWTQPMVIPPTPMSEMSQPMWNIASRPSNPVEQMTLEQPIRIVDAEGRREMRVCCDLRGFKPEEITVTMNKAERAVVIEATAEAKDSKEHQVARKYSRKVVLPESPICKIDAAACGPISAVQRPDGMLIVELPLPKLTVEEMARYPQDTYWTRPNTVSPVPVKSI